MAPRRVDIAIVGAGPAGIAAGIHAARAGVSHVVLHAGVAGGLLRAANRVENYPGVRPMRGEALAARMVSEAVALGVTMRRALVKGVRGRDGGFTLRTGAGSLSAAAVVLATGAVPDRPSVPGVAAAARRHLLHADILTVPPGVRGREIAVIGGGEAAMDTALSLRDRGANVVLYVRGKQVKSNAALAALFARSTIPVKFGHDLAGISGRRGGLRLLFRTPHSGSRWVAADRLVACLGRRPDLSLWRAAAGGGAKPPTHVGTSVPGLFCAGDMIRDRCRYATVAAGDGTRAGHLAVEYVRKHRRRQR